jgi:hypothetical protein
LILVSPQILKTHLLQPVNFCGEHEVAFGQSINLMRENGDLYLAPGEQQIRMMPLLLGDGSNPIHKIESGLEIRKSKHAMQVVLIDNAPVRNLRFQRIKLRTFEGGNATPAWNTGLVG